MIMLPPMLQYQNETGMTLSPCRSDAHPFGKLGQRIPPFRPEHVDMINVPGPWPLGRQLDDAFQSLVVARGDFPAMIVQCVDVAQSHAAHRRLDFIETKIVTDELV